MWLDKNLPVLHLVMQTGMPDLQEVLIPGRNWWDKCGGAGSSSTPRSLGWGPTTLWSGSSCDDAGVHECSNLAASDRTGHCFIQDQWLGASAVSLALCREKGLSLWAFAIIEGIFGSLQDFYRSQTILFIPGFSTWCGGCSVVAAGRAPGGWSCQGDWMDQQILSSGTPQCHDDPVRGLRHFFAKLYVLISRFLWSYCRVGIL